MRVFGNSLPPRPSKTELNEVAKQLLPLGKHQEYNYGLLDLGRLVCRYTNPKCNVCPLSSICDFPGKSIAEHGGVESTDPSGSIHSKLKIARQQNGLSLQRLAELAGISKLTVIRIESGKSTPRRETLKRLAIALQVEPGELIG